MKIEWSKLSPEDRDRAVCEAVGIPGQTRYSIVRDGDTHNFYGWFETLEQAEEKLFKIPKFKGQKIGEGKVFPKVTTDANEALKVWKLTPEVFVYPVDFDGNSWKAVLVTDSNDWVIMCEDFSSAVCIAAMKTKNVEVEL